MAERRGEKVFSTFVRGSKAEEITFAALYERSRHYASALAGLGVGRDSVVLIILQHTPHLFYSFFGAVLAGAIPSFMPFPSVKQRSDAYWRSHEKLFDRIRPALIVTYRENAGSFRRNLPGSEIPLVIADDALLHGRPASAEEMPGLASGIDDIACLQHSSGTTHLKKGVMLSNRAILGQIESYSRILKFNSGDSIASWLPLYHDMGFVACFLMSVAMGTHLVSLDPFEWVMRPEMLLDAIQRYRTSFCWLPNFAFTHIVNLAKPGEAWNLSSMRAFINCSEPCKAVTFERFFERFRSGGVTVEKLQVCYAMAENVFCATQTPLGEPVRTLSLESSAYARGEIRKSSTPDPPLCIVSCGRPIGGVRVQIVDDSGILPEGRIGEIRLSGEYLFEGYYCLPEQTKASLREGWYYTGDMGFVSDGEIFVTGRKDDMLISNGRNYYAHEIEAIVNAVPGIIPGRNIAIGVDDQATDATNVVVLAECRADAKFTELRKQLRNDVQEALGLAIHSLVPLVPGSLVKTTSGKIARAENKRLYLERGFQSRPDARGGGQG